MIKVLIVDDRGSMLEAYRTLLQHQPDLDLVGEAQDVEEAAPLIESLDPDVVVLDTDISRSCGIDLLRGILRVAPSIRVLVVAAAADAALTREVMAEGAAGLVVRHVTSQQFVSGLRTIHSGQSCAILPVASNSTGWVPLAAPLGGSAKP